MCNYYFLSIITALLTSAVGAQEPPGSAKKPFKNEREEASYAFGMNIARGLKEGRVDLDPDGVARGFKDAMAGGRALLSEAQMNEALGRFGRELMALQQQRRDQLAEENRQQGEAFLTRNKALPEVVSLPSGLQYKVLAAGAGTSPDLTNWVRLRFHARRVNGTEFESSDAHPEAGIFSLRGVIQGWAEALQLMKPGAKWRLFVPPGLAYGKEGSPAVGPNETLIYDLELVALLPARPEPTAEDLKNERAPDGD